MAELSAGPAAANPVLVERCRGPAVERAHRGAFAVVNSAGAVVDSAGDVATPIYPRSAIKPLQALVLMECGAADRFAISDEEIALACASHGATPAHVAAVAAWLDRMGLDAGDLGCGPSAPLDDGAALALDRAGQVPSRLHNNCSGKHAGFLAAALHLNSPVVSYFEPDHPVQRRVAGVLADLAGCDPATAPLGVDGCGVPTWGLPLAALARAGAALARPDKLGSARGAAVERILAAMTSRPMMVGGPGRFDSLVMEAAGGAVAVKGGAEGVQRAILPVPGLGIAVKVDDGAKAAAESVMAALLARHAAPDDKLLAALEPWRAAPVLNTRGSAVGGIRLAGPLA
jgi:L-asparaginase II